MVSKISKNSSTSVDVCKLDLPRKTPNLVKEESIPDVVVFDLTGTLIDSLDEDAKILNKVLMKYERTPWEIARYKKHPLKSIKESFKDFCSKENVNNAYREYIDLMKMEITNTPLVSGTKQVLKYLKMLDIPTFVVSNRDIDYTNFALKHYDILKYFSAILTPDTTNLRKPSPFLKEWILKSVNKMDNAFVVGDSYVDFLFASNIKSTPVLLLSKSPDIDQSHIEKWKTEGHKVYYIKNHFDFINIIKKIINEN